MTDSIDLPRLPERPSDANKGTFGRVLIVAGSRRMSGAAALAGLGALRGGAGLVELAVPVGIQRIVATIEPSWLTIPVPEDADGRIGSSAMAILENRWKTASVVAIGSGWGVSDSTRYLAAALVEWCPKPMVIDADGLNALVESQDVWRRAVAPRVITPHPGEFSRLTGISTKEVQTNRVKHASQFAKEHGLIVVLKGAGTVITDGERSIVNETGNAGMATGGTGDVLTGVIASLVAQGMSAFDAAHLGVHLHGLAGDLAAEELSEPALIASDLPRFLGPAWRKILQQHLR